MRGSFRTELAGSPEAARTARALIRQVLGSDHPSAHDAQLVASELVSNGHALAHSRSGQPGGTLTLEVSARSGDVVIRVNDDGGAVREPAVRAPGADSEHGRGLRIVAALAAEWGTEPSASGRATWCRLSPCAEVLHRSRDVIARREAGDREAEPSSDASYPQPAGKSVPATALLAMLVETVIERKK
jgi:serine/threonine-protein kinase RsbW